MRKVISSLLIFIFAFFVFSVTKVSAKILTDEKGNVNVAKTEVINDDLFIGTQTAVIDGTVNGDVFIGAQTVKVTGLVNGSLHIGANTVDITGTVKGNVYAGAQNILVSGAKIGGSLLVGGATVNIDKDSTIGGSVLAGAGSLSLDSQVKRSVYVGVGNLTIGADTKIGKDLYYAAGNGQGQASISEKAKISGNTYKSEIKTPEKNVNLETAKKQVPAFLNGVRFVTTITSFLGALIIGFLYLKFFAGHFTQTAGLVSKSFWKALGIGFLVTIALVPGLIILLVTVIGIPLAGLAFLLFLLYASLTKIIVGSALGNWLSQKLSWKTSTFGAFALGLFVIYLLKLIPVVGSLTGLVVFWAGLGAFTLRIFSKSECC